MSSVAQYYFHSLQIAQKTYNTDVRLHTIKGYASNQLERVPVRRSRAQERTHTALPRLTRMVCSKLKSMAHSALCASVSINVFFCLSRILLFRL